MSMRLRIGDWEPKVPLIAAVAGGLSVLVLVAVVAVMLPRESADTVDEPPVPLRYEWATADRLVLPDDYGEPVAPEWVAYRPRRESWTDEQIAEYWLDPHEIGLEVLDARVEEHVRMLLREVP